MLSAHAKVTLEPGKVIEGLLDEFECLAIEDRLSAGVSTVLSTAWGLGSECFGS